MRKALFIVMGLVAFVAAAEKQPFERYQSIIDRQMFGQPPKGFDPTKLPSEVSKSSMSEKELTAEQEVIQKAIHFSVINVTPSGEVAVGFSDNSDPKLPIHYYMKVGETENKWTVKEADAEKATMTIANEEGVEVSLTLGDNSATANSSGGSSGQKSKADKAASAGGSSLARAGGLLGGSQTLRARRQRREEADAAARAKEQAAAAEKAAAEKAEREEREAAEKAEREAERAEQRKELLAIQEQLRRVREEKAQQNQNADDSVNEEN